MNLLPAYDMSCFGFPVNTPGSVGPRILPTSQRYGPLGNAHQLQSGHYRGSLGSVNTIWDTNTEYKFMNINPGLGQASLGPGMMNPNAYATMMVNQATAGTQPIVQLGALGNTGMAINWMHVTVAAAAVALAAIVIQRYI